MLGDLPKYRKSNKKSLLQLLQQHSASPIKWNNFAHSAFTGQMSYSFTNKNTIDYIYIYIYTINIVSIYTYTQTHIRGKSMHVFFLLFAVSWRLSLGLHRASHCLSKQHTVHPIASVAAPERGVFVSMPWYCGCRAAVHQSQLETANKNLRPI